MNAFNAFIAYIQQLNEKNFYTYSATLVGGVVVLSILILFGYYYRNAQYLLGQIENANEMRERVRELLIESTQVQKQKAEVNKMIEQDEDFNIVAYFRATLVKLGLDKKMLTNTNTRTDREDNYSEEELKAQLVDLNMKELTELLQELEHNKRIYAKDLDITKKSKKGPKTIEINITIATLIKKSTVSAG